MVVLLLLGRCSGEDGDGLEWCGVVKWACYIKNGMYGHTGFKSFLKVVFCFTHLYFFMPY